MAPKIKFSKFSNLPCLLAEVMVKDFFLFFLFIAVIFQHSSNTIYGSRPAGYFLDTFLSPDHLA